MSVYIGIVHLLIGQLVGLYNMLIQRGGKFAFIHKGGMIFSFFGMIFLCYALTDFMFNSASITEGITFITLILGVVCIVAGVAINTKAEGAMQAVMGIPEIIGQILSYTRLAAIAMSKAGMALAFNYIIFKMIIPSHTVDGDGHHRDRNVRIPASGRLDPRNPLGRSARSKAAVRRAHDEVLRRRRKEVRTSQREARQNLFQQKNKHN